MKSSSILLLMFISAVAYSQTSTRCAVCPPSLSGVSNGSILTDSSGYARWKAAIFFTSGYSNGSLFYNNNDTLATNSALRTGVDGNGYTVLSVGNVTDSGIVETGTVRLTSNDNAYSTIKQPNGSTGGCDYTLPLSCPNDREVLTSDSAGQWSWQSFVGTPIKDSIAATGATVSPAINTTHVITSAGAITSATLAFPSGTTGNWIIVIFEKAIVTLTNSGTGAGLVSLVAPVLGTSKVYVNIGGNWY